MRRFLALCVVLLMLPCIALATSIPDTGQTKCYDNTEEIPCPNSGESFYGQDTQYLCNPHSYTDLGNGIVRDNVTGLEWQQFPERGAISWYGAIDYCNALTLGGYSDWRLPTIKEISTLVDSSIPSPGPTIDSANFPNAVATFYWSSTLEIGGSYAWTVNFDGGFVSCYNTWIPYPYVRAVRGGQSGPFDDSFNFVDNGDSTITDLETHLMWEAKTDDGGPRDKDNTYTWQEALSYCENLILSGYSDWRLPNRNELQSIVDYSRYYNPSIDPIFSYTVSSYYWSSTTNASTTDDAWSVRFDYGYVHGDVRKSFNFFVRAVRAGQCESFADSDGDSILDDVDNCPNNYNPFQEDSYPSQGNGCGDACECEGDFAYDGDVDGSDASTFKVDFGRSNIVHPCIAGDTCNGDFSCNGNVDGSDAAIFKQDFGRSSLQNPCPASVVVEWCNYSSP